jgi:hypothetical protein
MYTEQELNNIYNTEVKRPLSYFKKYEVLPPCPVKRWNYKWEGHDFPRAWCILDFIEWKNKYHLNNLGTMGYTCDSDPELEFIEAKEKIYLTYPKYDMHDLSIHFKEKFDFFIFNQTLEHLYNPFLAMKNLYVTIKPGGYVFTSVPTINIPHSTPIHYNGLNPMGLAMLFKISGFKIIDLGQWGNFEYIQKMFYNHSWPGCESLINNDGKIPNEERNVCQTWILVQK